MTSKRSLVFIMLIMILILGLTACERSLSSDVATPTTNPNEPAGSGGADDVMEQIWQLATQTAMAQQGPVEADGTATPAANALLPTDAAATAEPTSLPTETPMPTMVPVPTATPGLPSTYTLQEGEFAFCIARRFNVDPVELLTSSGLGANSLVYAGMTLTIPQGGQPFPGERTLYSHPTTHTVSAGETIYSIACKYGDVDPSSIAIANGLEAPYKLTAGQTLQIP